MPAWAMAKLSGASATHGWMCLFVVIAFALPPSLGDCDLLPAQAQLGCRHLLSRSLFIAPRCVRQRLISAPPISAGCRQSAWFDLFEPQEPLHPIKRRPSPSESTCVARMSRRASLSSVFGLRFRQSAV